MPVGGNLAQFKGLLYSLKRRFGCPLDVYNQSPESIDLTTGRATITKSSIQIARAIIMPSQVHRSFSYDIGYLKANSNFTYGGIYTEGTRQIIIDRADLPPGYTIDSTDQFYIVYDGCRYEIKEVAEFEYKLAYLITANRLDGAIINEIFNLQIRDQLCLSEELTGGTDEYELIDLLDILEFEQSVTFNAIRNLPVIDTTLIFTEQIGLDP
jgi:hypothetical protein